MRRAVRRQSVDTGCRVDGGRVTGRRRRTTSSVDAKGDRPVLGRRAEQASSAAEGAAKVLPSQRDPLNLGPEIVAQSSGS